jgi:APA family basic amino acid/polyamine antiporter
LESCLSKSLTPEGNHPVALARELNLRDGIAVVVGTIIGSGIYLVPGPIAHQLHPFSSVLLVWIIGGLLSLFGALSIAELAALYPSAGGLYVYLRNIYGRPVAFLYGWSLFSVIHSGSLATLATGFSLYFSQLNRFAYLNQKIVAVACIATLSVINCLGLARAKVLQNLSTFFKIFGLSALVVSLFLRGHISVLDQSIQVRHIFTPPVLSFGIALTAVLWGYEGWLQVSFVAAEFLSPQRDLP